MFFKEKLWQKFASFVALLSVFFSIGAPIAEAKALFDFDFGNINFIKKDKQKDISEKPEKELPPISREKIVAILVQEELLDTDLKGDIERYAQDVQNELNSRAIVINVPEDASPKEIQEGLAQLYFSGYENDHKSQLIGTILIGEVPLPIVDKNGGLNPAIFPYVDFEDTSYQWDFDRKRFKWVGGDNEPEIWHGLIRSDADDLELQIAELKKYFTRNHQVHQKKINYSKKVFFADFFRQRRGISEKQKQFYENWINHLGDFVYHRFNKHWLQELLDKEMGQGVPNELLPNSMQGQDQSMDLSQIPDIFTKNPIETMSMRYLTANKNLLSQINEQVEVAGRWEAPDIDTTISLIAKKDQWASDILKEATDEVENILINKVDENNIAAKVNLIIEDVGCVNNDESTCLKHFPAEWLGIPFSKPVENKYFKKWNWRTGEYETADIKYPAENCSLYRGTLRSDSNPIAQKVEISRVFNPHKFSKVVTSDDIYPDDRCCGKISGSDIDYHKCRLPLYISHMRSNEEVKVHYYWDKAVYDPTQSLPYNHWYESVNSPIFSMTGSREISDSRYDGASACAPIILELQDTAVRTAAANKKKIEISSLMVHNEPTIDTIKAQLKNKITNALPIDPHHGISFYDYDYNFYRIYFPSAFDLINKREETDENFEILTKADLEQQLLSTIDEINSTAGNAGKIQESYFADSIWMNSGKQKELIEAIKWLGKDLETKNIEMLTAAMSAPGKARNALKQSDFDGYELIEIRGELADFENNNGLKIAFERGDEKPSTSFVDLKNQADITSANDEVATEYKKINSRENLKLQQEFEKLFEKSASENSCTGNIFSWPSKCLVPWLQELPNVLSKITKLIPNVDLEKEDSSENTDKNPAKNLSSFDLSPVKTADEIVISEIAAEPSAIKISNNETFPQEIKVTLKDADGKILKNDYSTEVELISNSSDLENFFTITPAKKVLVKAGQAKFFLLPKRGPNGGVVKFKFRGNSVESNEVQIKISTKRISASSDKEKITAGDGTGTEISAKILDNEGNIDHSFDGEILEFTSEKGRFFSEEFTSGARAKIKDGIAKIVFLPGIKAGEAEIIVQDEQKLLPPAKIYFDILPAEPAKIEIFSAPDKLVINGVKQNFFTGITDKYGNEIPELAEQIKWQIGENLTLEKGEKAGEVFIQAHEPEEEFLKKITKILPTKKSPPQSGAQREIPTEHISLVAEIPTKEDEKPLLLKKSRAVPRKAVEILLAKNPVFETIIPEKDLRAGDTEPLKIKVLAKTADGKILKNDFVAQVLVSDKAKATALPEIVFENGEAELEIFAGEKAGNLNVQISAPGFVKNNFSLQIFAGDPYQIQLLSSKKTLNVDDENPLDLQVRVLDKYGNLADFDGEVQFAVNPPENFADKAQDLKDLNILDNPAKVDALVQNQNQNPANSSPVISLESENLTITNGLGINKIYPVEHGGKAYIVAQNDDLLPGTIEIDAVKVLTTSDFKHLSPKSLLTLLLGFAGGDLTKPNIGNRFLFDGETQAVATQIADKKQAKKLGNIFADGKISTALRGTARDFQPEVVSGSKWEVVLNKKVSAKFNFDSKVDFWAGRKKIEEDGIYFIPVEELDIKEFYLKSREIFYQEQPLFKIAPQGGIFVENSKLELRIKDNSLYHWEVYLEGKLLGEIILKMTDPQFNLEELQTPKKLFSKKEAGLEVSKKVSEIFQAKNFAGNSLFFQSLDPSIKLEKSLNGLTTTSPKGIAVIAKNEFETPDKILKAPNFPTTDEKLGWTTSWKGGLLFAAKNSVGEATKFSCSENCILLGDPTLSVASENEKSELGLTKDLGKPIYRTNQGVIDEVMTGDLNFDNSREIFVRSGDTLSALYADPHNQDNFRDIGKILRFADGAKQTVAYNKNNGDLEYIIQINDEGKLIFHHNQDGKFSREKINLGLLNPIEKIAVAKLNSDAFDDLVLLDDSNNLYFVYGREGGFYSAQLLDSAGATFQEISEYYTTADGQNRSLKYINPDKFKNLQNFFAGFSNILDYAWTPNLRKIGETDFLRVTENKAFNIKFEMTQENPRNLNNLKVQKDSEFTAKVTIYSPNIDLENFKLIVPKFAGFQVDTNSFDFTNCEGNPEISEKSESMMISGCNIPKQQLVRISWKLKTVEVPLISFKVVDFVGKDGIDDILIPWVIDGKKKFIEYLSYGSGKLYPPNPAKKTPDAPASPIVKTHLKKIVDAFPEGTTFPSDFDAESTASDMLECLTSSDDGLPPFYHTLDVEELMQEMSVKQNFAGLQIPSIAFLAPGPQSIYIPPFAFPGPQFPGFPILWVGPSTPFVGVGPNSTSLFRLYIMPTTTLRVGIGICGGPVIDSSMSPTGSPFPPQCFVIVPPLSSSSSSGNGNNNDTSNNCIFENPANSDENASRNAFLQNSFADNGNVNYGTFAPLVGGYSQNLNIAAPDIITEWAKAQMDEFSNYKFPQFDIILPKFPKLKFGDKSMKPLDRLAASPYFEVKRKNLQINYPDFSREKLDKLKTDFSFWKKSSADAKASLSQSLVDLELTDFQDFDRAIADFQTNFNNNFSAEINLPDLSKLPPDLQLSIKNEVQNIKTRSAELKNLVNEKLIGLKNTPQELKNSAKNKIQEQIDEIEKIETVLDENLRALDSYMTEIKKLKELPKKIKRAVEEMEKINEVVEVYWSTWINKNKQAVKEWKKFAKKVKGIVDTWNDIPNLFKDFTVSCVPGGGGGASSVNRGTMISWLLKILLSAVKLPVIPMPQMQNTMIDLSDVKIGVSVTVPEISFSPVPVSLPKLPTTISAKINPAKLIDQSLNASLKGFTASIGSVGKMTDLTFDSLEGITNEADLLIAGKNIENKLKSYNASLDSSLSTLSGGGNFHRLAGHSAGNSANYNADFIAKFPTIKVPNIVVLPPLPKVVPEIKVPTINLPQLPTLLPPPNFPNILKPVTAIVSAFKPFMKTILCWLSMGIIPIPEWKVASRVVQLTNRTSLLPMDFVPSAQLPLMPKMVAPTINIKPKVPLVPAFESVNASLTALAQTMNAITNTLSTMGKGGIPNPESIIPRNLPTSSIKNEKVETVAINLFDEVEDNSGEIDTRPVLQKLKKLADSATDIPLDFQQKKIKSRLEKHLALYKNMLASADDVPNFLPDNVDTSKYDPKNIEPQPIAKLYYYDSQKDKAEVITDFPVNGKIHTLNVSDLDEDGTPELLYSIDGQLFMKRLKDKFPTESQTSKEVIHQNFAEFSKYFAPAIELNSETNAIGSSLEFLPPKSREISYFEWIISERPDRIFEKTPKSRAVPRKAVEKYSKEWKRIGFLIRPKGHKYEIRPGVAQIKKIVGHPILYGNKMKKIARFSASECRDPEVVKPFFPEETILVGIGKESQFRVKTKKREGQQAEERDIILRAGEETAVDFAEICLTRGEINYLDLGKIEKFVPKVGDHFFSNMRFELGNNDEVELNLYNDTKVHIYGGESYELHSFNSRENFIDNFQKLNLGNHYGQFKAFKKDGESFVLSKNLLHDPQPGDDTEPPQIIISQGSKIEAFITAPIEIDASGSYDNQKISRVWWKRDGHIFLDSDKDKKSPTQLLKIKLPAKNFPQNFEVELNIADESGNIATQIIPIEVKVPKLKLIDVSRREQKIRGKIKEGISGLRVGVLRERKGRKDILEKTAISEKGGNFVLEELGTSGNILLKDKNTKEVLAAILPTGRPMILNSKKAHTRITTKPFAIKITDDKMEEMATITLKTSGENDVKINSNTSEIPAKSVKNSSEIQVVDADDQDDFVWQSFSDGVVLLDNANKRTVGILNNSGKFEATDYLKNLKILPKKATDEKEPLIFTINIENEKGIDKKIAEFFIPVKDIVVQ